MVDKARLIEVELAEDGSIDKFVVEQKDHSTRELALKFGVDFSVDDYDASVYSSIGEAGFSLDADTTHYLGDGTEDISHVGSLITWDAADKCWHWTQSGVYLVKPYVVIAGNGTDGYVAINYFGNGDNHDYIPVIPSFPVNGDKPFVVAVFGNELGDNINNGLSVSLIGATAPVTILGLTAEIWKIG